jgi:hypothetical protein
VTGWLDTLDRYSCQTDARRFELAEEAAALDEVQRRLPRRGKPT